MVAVAVAVGRPTFGSATPLTRHSGKMTISRHGQSIFLCSVIEYFLCMAVNF